MLRTWEDSETINIVTERPMARMCPANRAEVYHPLCILDIFLERYAPFHLIHKLVPERGDFPRMPR